MNWKIPLFKIYWDEDDVTSVNKVIKRASFWATGPEIGQLEKSIAKYIGRKYCLSFNSGTSALHASLLSHNIKSGEVIVPSFTFISTANCVAIAGAKPIFSEIEEDTYGLDSEDVKKRITSKTKAIIPVHYGGSPCKEINSLREIAEDHNLILIEDAAESIGSKIDNKLVGTSGHSSMFSFCQNKIITSGEGGVIVTDSEEVYEKLKLIRSHGRVENKNGFFSTPITFDYILAGYNYRMSSLTASLALSQFKKINKIINLRREKARYLNEKLAGIEGVKIPNELKGHFHVYQLYTIQLEDNKTREKLQQSLIKTGIMSKVYFSPVHLKTLYREYYNYKEGDLPITENISQKVLTLPLYPTLTNKEMDYIIDRVRDCCE